MSTPDPLDDLVLPYAVTFLPTAGSVATIPVDQRNESGTHVHRLLPGTYMLSLSYDGDENCFISFSQFQGGYINIAETGPPSERGPRSSPVVTVTVLEPYAMARVTSSPVFRQGSVDGKKSLSLQVYPLSTYQP